MSKAKNSIYARIRELASSEEEAERAIKAREEYLKDNSSYVSSLLREEARSRYSAVDEKDSATLYMANEVDDEADRTHFKSRRRRR